MAFEIFAILSVTKMFLSQAGPGIIPDIFEDSGSLNAFRHKARWRKE